MARIQDLFDILTRRKIAVTPGPDSLAHLLWVMERRGIDANAVADSVGQVLRALEDRAISSTVQDSAGWYLWAIWSQVATYLATRADGTIWTSTLANKLNTNADATISGVPALAASAVWGAGSRTLTALPSIIKSIQHKEDIVVTTAEVVVALSPTVTTSKSLLILNGFQVNDPANGATDFKHSPRLRFISGSQVGVKRLSTSGSIATTVNFSVVEFN